MTRRAGRFTPENNKKVKVKKVKQPYFTSITRDSNSADKLEVDG